MYCGRQGKKCGAQHHGLNLNVRLSYVYEYMAVLLSLKLEGEGTNLRKCK